MAKEIKEEERTLELDLNRITLVEGLAYPDTFKEYKNMAVVLSQIKDWYLSEEEVLGIYGLDNIQKILEQYPHIVKTNAHWKNEKGTFDIKYVDIASVYNIKPSDPYYDIFFARKIRQLDLLELDAFLDYHTEHYYNNNLQDFSRFLRICIRKHTTTFLNTETIQTINEWIEAKEKQQSVLQRTSEKQIGKERKNKVTRASEDKKTCLSLEQTVLLIHYLQQERVFLNDEYLNDTEMGTAFEILTGYSPNTIRINLGDSHLQKNKSKINLTKVDKILSRLQIAVGNDLKGK